MASASITVRASSVPITKPKDHLPSDKKTREGAIEDVLMRVEQEISVESSA